VKEYFNRFKEWCKKRWHALLAAIVGSVVLITTFYYKLKHRKNILKNANDAHEAENKVNEEARKTLTDGLEEIRKSEEDAIEKTLDDHEKEKEKLKKEKEKFIDESSKNSEELAKKIADSIGADFVPPDKD
jgi:uncharacterized protein HemX